MVTDFRANLDVFVANLSRTFISGSFALDRRQRRQQGLHIVQSPAQINRRRPSCIEMIIHRFEIAIRRIFMHCQGNTISCRCANQRRTPNPHVFDRYRCIAHCLQTDSDKFMRQFCLINNLRRPAIFGKPDRAGGGAIYFQVLSTRPATASSLASTSGSRASGAVINALSSA